MSRLASLRARRSVATVVLTGALVVRVLLGSGSAEGVSGDHASAPTLTIFCWRGYLPDDVTEAFTKETGIEVIKEFYATNEQLLLHRLVDRRYDLIQPSDYAAERLIKRGALEKLRRSRIANLKNLDERFRGLPHDPTDQYTVPWLVGTVGIVINTNRVSGTVATYEDVFSGKYRGRIVALNDPREWLAWAQLHRGLPVNQADEETLRDVGQVWRRWMPQVAVFDSDTAARLMLKGEADIALTWSGDAATLLAASSDFQFVIPAAGAHRYVDCLAIPRGAANRDAAERFIDFILRPEISVMISRNLPFTNPNREALTRLSPEEKTNPASYPRGEPEFHSFRPLGKRYEHVEKLYYQSRFRPPPDGTPSVGVPGLR